MTDEEIMKFALDAAQLALPYNDVPIGAVVVKGGKVIASAFNRREADGDPTAHAEVLALREASRVLGRWNLSDCELFVTLEPCVMCAGAAVYSRISRIVYGVKDERFGACGTLLNIANNEALNHRCEVKGGVLEGECLAPIREFFKELRKKPKKKAAEINEIIKDGIK